MHNGEGAALALPLLAAGRIADAGKCSCRHATGILHMTVMIMLSLPPGRG